MQFRRRSFSTVQSLTLCPVSDRKADALAVRKVPKQAHAPQQNGTLFNHLIGAGEHKWRNEGFYVWSNLTWISSSRADCASMFLCKKTKHLHRTAVGCFRLMTQVCSVPTLGGMPELYTYRCVGCGDVHKQSRYEKRALS